MILRLRLRRRHLSVIAVVAASLAAACGADFRPKNAVEQVRILASKADLPYAHPGETVHIDALADDGRPSIEGSEPMRFFWFPAPCIDPPGGQYYGCYLALGALPIGVDLTPQLREARDTTITIPQDALAHFVPQPGAATADKVATAFVFMAACAGHLERVTPATGEALNSLPIGCFGANGARRGTQEFVLGYTRVFIFETRRNAVPTMDGLTIEGANVDLTKGIVTGKCVRDPKTKNCKTVKLDVNFQDAMSEPDPDNVDANGNPQRETLYVDYFTTVGKFSVDRKIVFDGTLGRAPKTGIDFAPPGDPVKGTIWAVFHDNRGGTSWFEVPIDIQ